MTLTSMGGGAAAQQLCCLLALMAVAGAAAGAVLITEAVGLVLAEDSVENSPCATLLDSCFEQATGEWVEGQEEEQDCSPELRQELCRGSEFAGCADLQLRCLERWTDECNHWQLVCAWVQFEEWAKPGTLVGN